MTKNFTKFASRYKELIVGHKLGFVEDYGVPNEIWSNRVGKDLQRCKIFEINNNLKRLLLLTKCPKSNEKVRLPFPATFIDVDFSKDEVMQLLGIKIPFERLEGLLVTEENLSIPKDIPKKDGEVLITPKMAKGGKVAGRVITYEFYCDEIDDGDLFHGFKTFREDLDVISEYENRVTIRKTYVKGESRKLIHEFVLNLLNFINDPEVELVDIPADKEKNIKRIKKNKFPISDRIVIKLNGYLREYIDKTNKQKNLWHYSHRFWVRGHWRTLRDEKWGKKQGDRIWIAPYIKGKGILINRKYNAAV